jgi:hypothetical protein
VSQHDAIAAVELALTEAQRLLGKSAAGRASDRYRADQARSPNVRTRSSGWIQALQAFTMYFEGRIPTP